jgi:hypothetical protein
MEAVGISRGTQSRSGHSARFLFGAAMLGLMGIAASLAGYAPLGFSIVIVFLFAGPHNWFEFRYFLARMPAHWGPLRGYFSLAIGGVLALTATFAALPYISVLRGWTYDEAILAESVWNTFFVLWVATLAWMRGKQRRRDWGFAFPIALAVIAFFWIFPNPWQLALVYLHPLVALFFLDRELLRSKPEWRSTYHACLALVPLVLGGLWLLLSAAPNLPGDDALSARITQHSGAHVLQNVSTHFLVAAHTFLEMLHYGVWILAIPLIGLKRAPWDIVTVPLSRRSVAWRRIVTGIVLCGAVVVVCLWCCFLADYPATRDVYFTVAMCHVLAEFPFLLRTL